MYVNNPIELVWIVHWNEQNYSHKQDYSHELEVWILTLVL